MSYSFTTLAGPLRLYTILLAAISRTTASSLASIFDIREYAICFLRHCRLARFTAMPAERYPRTSRADAAA